MRGLHRLLRDTAQLGAQRVEVDLVAQPARERRERLRRVVAAAVEAAVHRRLDAGARGPEQRRDRQRRRRDREPGVRRQRLEHELEEQHDHEVGGGQRGRQRAVDERAVDDDVDVVEPVSQDRHRSGRRGRRHHQAEHAPGDDLARPGVEIQHAVERQEHRQRGDRVGGGQREPLELLALQPAGSAKAIDDRDDREQQRDRRRRRGRWRRARAEDRPRRRGRADCGSAGWLSGPGSNATTTKANALATSTLVPARRHPRDR